MDENKDKFTEVTIENLEFAIQHQLNLKRGLKIRYNKQKKAELERLSELIAEFERKN